MMQLLHAPCFAHIQFHGGLRTYRVVALEPKPGFRAILALDTLETIWSPADALVRII